MSLIETLERDRWLALDSNRAQWERLASACALADGFALFAVQVEDPLAASHVASLLAEQRGGLPVVVIELQPDTSVAALLEQLRTAARPCLFWLVGEHTGPEFASFFALLNQKREVVSALSDGPLVIALHPLAWAHFRHAAPDFWSIHQAVFRFTAARRVTVEPVRHVRSASRGPTPKSLPRASWRLDEASLAGAPTPLAAHETELRRLVAALHEPGATILVEGPTGSGKTTLVAAALPAIAKRHLGGIFRVPVDGVSGSVEARASAILTTLLSELRWRVPVVRGQSTGSERLLMLQRHFVHATGGRAALFWFEDVETPELLEWLVPGPGSSLVVTSRRALPMPNSRVLEHVVRLALHPTPHAAPHATPHATEERTTAASRKLPAVELGLSEASPDDTLEEVDAYENSLALQQLGEQALQRGDLASAQRWFEKLLALEEALGEPPKGLILLARLDRVRGDLEAAVNKLARACDEFRMLDSAIVEDELRACHDSATPELRARMRATWEAAGHEWPLEADNA